MATEATSVQPLEEDIQQAEVPVMDREDADQSNTWTPPASNGADQSEEHGALEKEGKCEPSKPRARRMERSKLIWRCGSFSSDCKWTRISNQEAERWPSNSSVDRHRDQSIVNGRRSSAPRRMHSTMSRLMRLHELRLS